MIGLVRGTCRPVDGVVEITRVDVLSLKSYVAIHESQQCFVIPTFDFDDVTAIR